MNAVNISDISVAVCGLGGLGSNIAVMLARSGIENLKLIDFDRVEESNLNRQTYCLKHIGMFKTVALLEQLKEINPAIKAETVNIKITAENAVELIKESDIICEAFDNPECKAMLTEIVLTKFPEKKLVCGSGMSGIKSANRIVTQHATKNLYICGDGESSSDKFYAPRVMICAGHQANMILRLINGFDEP